MAEYAICEQRLGVDKYPLYPHRFQKRFFSFIRGKVRVYTGLDRQQENLGKNLGPSGCLLTGKYRKAGRYYHQ